MSDSDVSDSSTAETERSYYPVFFDLRGRPVLIIGGGRLALEKARGLLAAGAVLTVAAPDLVAELAEMRDAGRIEHLARDYEPGDMAGRALIMAARDNPTDDPTHRAAENARLQRDARAIGVPINAADDPAHCDFILPAVVREPPLTLAISTGGGSPAAARRIREELAEYLAADTSSLAELLADVRADLRRLAVFGPIRADDWQAAIDGQLRILLAQRRRGQAKALLLSRLGAPIRAVDGP